MSKPKRSKRSLEAQARFECWASEAGYELHPFEWTTSRAGYAATCPRGHDCSPTPDGVQRGQGGCRTCGLAVTRAARVAQQTGPARDRFLAWASEAGYELHDFEWRGVRTRYEATCSKGHKCSPLPTLVHEGFSGCVACGGAPRTEPARDRFLAWASEAGYELHDFEWIGTTARYAATCPKGHSCNPHPSSVNRGIGGCYTCYLPTKSLEARDRFLAWVSEAGYELHDFEWRGGTARYSATCPSGHSCTPVPSTVASGDGGCGPCRGLIADVFYVVTGPAGVKFGVTSGDPRPRLADHRRDGYTTVASLHTGLDSTAGLDAERRCRAALAAAGLAPVRGREYYSSDALPLVLAAAGL